MKKPQLDARVTLTLTLFFCAAVATQPRIGVAGSILMLLTSTAVFLATRIPLRKLTTPMLAAAGLLAFFVLPAPFLEPGRALARWDLGPIVLAPTAEGLLFAATLVCKVSAAVAAVTSFAAHTRPAELARALRALRLPRVFVEVLLMTLRYLVVLRDEARRMLCARRCRAARKRPRPSEAGALLGTLFVRSLDRGERVHRAMLARGYQGEIPTLVEARIQKRDMTALLVGVSIVVALWFAARGLSGVLA